MAQKVRHKASGADEPKPYVSRIYEEHRAGLQRFAADRVSVKEDAEDIVQGVFQSLAQIDLVENPIGEISAWLYSATRNRIIDRSRKKKEEPMPQLKKGTGDDDDFIGDISDILAGSDYTPETEYLRSLVWDELEFALGELPQDQRTVFELTELQGFSFKEISESTGIPVATLISRKHYAILHLRERLKELYEDFTS